MEREKLKLAYGKDGLGIYNNNCFDVMSALKEKNIKPKVILTSPPYNNSRVSQTQRSIDNHETRYDIHLDNKSDEEYMNWTKDLFDGFNDILDKDGVILYNMSYGNENPSIMWLTIADIINRTDFMVADTIIWKKKSAIPNNRSGNKLTRIVEYVFVFCRKSEFKTFTTNKKVLSLIEKTGQKNYENIYNYIEARNNDGSCALNKATYSSELCEKLLSIYAEETSLVFDPFNGTGTTLVACKNLGLKGIGSELSEGQCEFAKERLEKL